MDSILFFIVLLNIIITSIISFLGLKIVFYDSEYKNLNEKDKNNYGRGLIDISIIILAQTILIYIVSFRKIANIIVLEALTISIVCLKYIKIKNNLNID